MLLSVVANRLVMDMFKPRGTIFLSHFNVLFMYFPIIIKE